MHACDGRGEVRSYHHGGMAVCCESSGRFSDSEHFAVVSVGMCKMVGIRGRTILCVLAG